MRLSILSLLLVSGIAVVFYFSWVPSPRLSLLGFVPSWLTRWTDTQQNENLRTAIPLLLLGLLAGCWLTFKKHPLSVWVLSWLGLVGVVLIAELGQLWLPLRHFDWGDVGWGALGALVGIGLVGAGTSVIRAARR